PRGEFIRTQCQLARMEDNDQRRPQLQVRERELLERHQEEWLGPLRPLVSGWTFRRGFLEAVAVPAGVYLSRTAFPWPATVRRVEVDLAGYEVPVDALEQVPESVAREKVLIPLGFRGRTLVLAMQDHQDLDLLMKLEFILNRDIELAPAVSGQVI